MADKFTHGQVYVNCRFSFLTTLHCSILAKYGEHTRAEITGAVESGAARAALSNVPEEKLEIVGRKDNGVEELLFAGVIERVELKEEGQYAILSVRAVSNTWKMDIERKSRSFQNLSMTYRDVAEKVAQECGAAMSWSTSDRSLEYPLIQYRETDYHFLKRILSHLGEGITSVDSRGKIHFCAGVASGSHIGRINLDSKRYSVVLFRNDKEESMSLGRRQVGYRIEDMDLVRVGDVLSIQGRAYYVMESSIVFRHNVLSCSCLVFPRQCFEVGRMPADTLQSAVIAGNILETSQEMVKLHLDIDREQAVEDTYNFPWKPITGNLLYCMPEKGTRAALYFGGGEESSAAVIYNIRENGEECGELDSKERYFTTDQRKRMYLKPSEAGFINMADQNAEVSLKDDSLIRFKSSHKISVMAEGQIELKGKRVTITAPKEATLVKKDIMSPTVINMCNAFDAIGTSGNFTAAPRKKKEERRKAITGQRIEKYSLEDVMEDILSNIPAEELGDSVMEAVAGSMPIISKSASVK